MPRRLTKIEFFVILVVFLVALLVYFLLPYLFNSSEVVAQVSYNGVIVEVISLDKDSIYTVDAIYPVTLEVKDGAIAFIDSLCPNHDCEGFGYISKQYETAICLPAKVSVQIVQSKKR